MFAFVSLNTSKTLRFVVSIKYIPSMRVLFSAMIAAVLVWTEWGVKHKYSSCNEIGFIPIKSGEISSLLHIRTV